MNIGNSLQIFYFLKVTRLFLPVRLPIAALLTLYLWNPHAAVAQVDSSLLIRRATPDTAVHVMNMDAIHRRPVLHWRKSPVSFGGYAEMKAEHLGTDGVSEGLAFSFQRLTFFVSSDIGDRFRFLTEVELESGGREINIEFASIDWLFHPMINLRAGIMMNPIGAFNQNHDGPKWEFTDRPLAATHLLPATWSNVGFGIFGKQGAGNWTFGYEACLTNGFDESVISNEENKTFLPATKENPDRFEETFAGHPLVTVRVAARQIKMAEVGLSYMGGPYSRGTEDGLITGPLRFVHALAFDFSSTIPASGTTFTGEWAWIGVDVPETYTRQYGSFQYGGFLDIVQPIIQKPIFGFEKASLNAALRLEYVDWNAGTFEETGGKISEDIIAVVPAISFRPSAQTVFRLNYRYQWQQDLLGNPPSKTGGLQIGFATYF